MRTSLVFAVALLLPAPLAAADRSDVVAACAWVRAENDTSGGGFVVDADKRRLVTCRHVVADRATVDVFFPWHRDGALVTDTRDYLGNRAALRERGLLVTGKVLRRHDAADLALVELESLPPGTKAVPLAATAARPGDALAVVGHRLDLDTLWNLTTGPARQTGRLALGYSWRGKKLAVNADVLIGQLPIEEGDSGGPVVNARGELVGMASALRRQTPGAAVAISVAEVRAFLALDVPKAEPKAAGLADALARATVWVRPTATDAHAAGVVIDRDRRLILTSASGSGTADRVGVAFALRAGDTIVGEREPYRDPVGLHLKGAWRAGTVVARDPARDLALVQLDSLPDAARAVPLAEASPAPGDAVHAMNHPGGLEFAWVYAAGVVRQRGRVALGPGEKPARVGTNILQIPAQAGSPGGPLLNDRGELVGVLSARESAQQTGYAATTAEIARFLDVAALDRPARTVGGLLARAEAAGGRLAAAVAEAFALRALDHAHAGRPADAIRDCRAAVAFDPWCTPARRCLVATLLETGDRAAAGAELDRAADAGPFDALLLARRAALSVERKDWRKARADLDRILDVDPVAAARLPLVGVLLELGKDDDAAAAVRDALRADAGRLPALAAALLEQADGLAKKFPAAPSVPANWLKLALAAVPVRRAEIDAALARAAAAPDDAARLAVLRAAVEKLAGR